jgi:hypothetical protein
VRAHVGLYLCPKSRASRAEKEGKRFSRICGVEYVDSQMDSLRGGSLAKTLRYHPLLDEKLMNHMQLSRKKYFHKYFPFFSCILIYKNGEKIHSKLIHTLSRRDLPEQGTSDMRRHSWGEDSPHRSPIMEFT